MKISIFDRGYLVGDGVRESLRVHEGVLTFLDEHLDQLWTGAATIDLVIGMSRLWNWDGELILSRP